MLKIKLLARQNPLLPESDNNQLQIVEVMIDETQIVCGVWGNSYSTLHTFTDFVFNDVKRTMMIRGVVRFTDYPSNIESKEIQEVFWTPCEDTQDLVRIQY